MNFFNLDMHASVIEDLKSIFTSLGHKVDNWSISNHCSVFGKSKKIIEMLENNNWKDIVKGELWKKFYELYKNELSVYDAFITCYPPVFALLYQLFQKPILMVIPIRYEYPYHFDAESWNFFNEFLKKGIDEKRIFLVANSVYEKCYCENFLDREINYIPNLCEYTRLQYQNKANAFSIYYSREKLAEVRREIIWKEEVLKFPYQWNDLNKFNSIVHFPYQVSTMSIFEHYTANFPLFFPTERFLLQLYTSGKNVLREITWNGYFGGQPGSVIKGKSNIDPNNFNSLSHEWLKYADYYNETWMPHIQYFDSFEQLNSSLFSCNFKNVSEQMRETNKWRKATIYQAWTNQIEKIVHS
jgi:hypothetical protein